MTELLAPPPTPDEIDAAIIASAFTLMADQGWRRLTVADAARHANIPLDKARVRFPGKLCLLTRFGQRADQAALTGALTEGPVRDRLFDIVMRRIDSLQAHRAGVVALLRDMPQDPLTALALAPASAVSASWMLQGAGIDTTGLRGHLRVNGMMALWIATVRAWQKDESEDLAATMAALDKALDRAGQAEATMADILGANMFGGRQSDGGTKDIGETSYDA